MRAGTLQFRIVLPLSLLILGTMIVFQIAFFMIARSLSEQYQHLIMAGHSRQVENIVSNAISELLLGRLLNNPLVLEAKKKTTIEEIVSYWRKNDLEGQVSTAGKVERSSQSFGKVRRYLPESIMEGPFHSYQGLAYSDGYVLRIPAWDWTVVMVSAPVNILSHPTTAAWFIPMVLTTFLLLLWAVRLVLRHNLSRPVGQMLEDLRAGRTVEPTGLKEIDHLGVTINRSLDDLRVRGEQLKMLHDISTRLNRAGALQEILRDWLDSANRILDAMHGALVVFPAGSSTPSLVLRLGDCDRRQIGPDCIRLWTNILDAGPELFVRNLLDDPEMTGLAEGCCAVLHNIAACGLRSTTSSGRDLVLLFANKANGFSREDSRLIRVLAGDVMETIGRMEAEAALRSSLLEKEVLLKEIHHRVKNNLQVISSLLTLQSAHMAEGSVRDIFRDSQDRIISMALIHEKLYESADLARVHFESYMESLIKGLCATYGAQDHGIVVRAQVDPTPLVVDTAIPCALIASELVSNSLKHAFPEGKTGTVCVRFTRSGSEDLTLEVVDDGVGLPPGLDPFNVKSLGLQLVSILGRQLGGRWEVGRLGGTSWRISFREYHEAGTDLV